MGCHMPVNKKIISIGMVKNEVDIIESYVRYNLNIVDGMVILDNGSTDNTLKILKELQNEGLALYILEDTDRKYEQAIKMNQLLLKAVNEFNADVVVPLDADEFLMSSEGGNPRKILENIEPNTYYLAKWKSYVPMFDGNEDEKFIPLKITKCRDDIFEEYYKVILPKELVFEYDVELTFGNHDLMYDPTYEEVINSVINPDLRIAHFPIRSKEQTISKIAVGWIYSLYRTVRVGDQSFHWKVIFDELKENEISNEDITNIAKQFALTNEKNVTAHEDPLDLTFCSDIEISYSNYTVQPIANILNSCEWLFSAYTNSINELNEEKEQLKFVINEYKNSKSWKITAPLRYISNKKEDIKKRIR
ncbi:glycosyltransferase family 2 protein [Methanobacterium sp. CWC-01]|nr:glycosyltransferase family 2 protein [Methanobacterium sp. CWC-01]